MSYLRTLTIALVAVVLIALGTSAATTATAASDAPAAPSVNKANTAVTVKIANCDGCKVFPSSIMAADPDDTWIGNGRKVINGEVTFQVPTDRTKGLVLGVTAPWEVDLPWQTIVVMGYKGYEAGDKISTSDAKAAKKGAACFAGTDATAVTVKLVVKKVTVEGNDGPTAGSIAFAKKTQATIKPLRPTLKGVLGSQDAIMCGPGGA
jgi:hypothetical protein